MRAVAIFTCIRGEKYQSSDMIWGNPDDVALVQLTDQAESLIENCFADPDNALLNLWQVGCSTRIREMLIEKGLLPEIDEIVYRLLPNQAL